VKALSFRIAAILLTAGGTIPTVLLIKKPVWLAPVLVFAVLLLTASVVLSELRAWRRSKPMQYPTPEKIRDFMFRWISTEGRVVIHTRDMSWAGQEARIAELLRAKAESGELTICLPHRIPLTDDLEQIGAHVLTYARLGFEPRSRFTIVRHGREDAQVAIGRQVHGVHTIATYSLGEHSVFALAEDLVEFVERINDA
jgi:hypothetical protein